MFNATDLCCLACYWFESCAIYFIFFLFNRSSANLKLIVNGVTSRQAFFPRVTRFSVQVLLGL